MQNKRRKQELSIQAFARIEKIFEDRSWPMESETGASYFDDFCQMLSEMNQSEVDLILDLTDRFIWISEAEYIHFFIKAFDVFVKELCCDGKKTIILCPLLREADFQRSKSSLYVLYLIKAHLPSLQRKYRSVNITIVDTPLSYFIAQPPEEHILCLIDDFVGSGLTASDALDFFMDKSMKAEKIVILSLIAMRSGIDYLREMGYNSYAGIVQDKAITGTADADNKARIMHSIEDRIKVKPCYRFGYEQSESLVKLLRTPNNTFPVYWLRNKENRFAPFPR